MGWRRLSLVGLMAVAAAWPAIVARAEDDAARKKDEQAIHAAAKDYLAALAKGDAQALAACWTADGEYIDEQGQTHAAGALAAEAQQAHDKGPKPEIRTTSSKIRFVAPDVALEDGSSEIAWPDTQESPVRGHFHATWVKQGGRWRLANLREIPEPVAADARLADLDSLVGTWTAEKDGTHLEATVAWNETGTWLLRDTKAVRDGVSVFEGSQRIGWDAAAGKLKSWSFDADGGHAEAIWTKAGDSWIEQATGVLPDGRTTSASVTITFDGKDSFVRKISAARVQGESVPDQEVRFTRLPAEKG